MKEEAKNGDYILCRSMLVLTLCAAVLGAAFYLGQLIRSQSTRRGEEKKIAVYELVWKEEEEDGGAVFYKWRYFIDAETDLPRKIEKYSRYEANGEYVLRETLIIDYPTDEQMREAIKDMYR